MAKGQNPFEGLKVLEFAWVVVGPLTGQYLSHYGATVIKIESHRHLDRARLFSFGEDQVGGLNTSGGFSDLNTSKYSATLDLGKEKGREIAWRLIDWADVVTESFAPGTMARWGLDYESVSKVKPDIIYFSTTQFGQTGPQAKFGGFGINALAVSGILELSGWPGGERTPPSAGYPDFTNPPIGASLIIAALDYKRRTGKGLYIDQSQVETCEHFIAPVLMDYLVNGNIASCSGNRVAYACPHGVYPCRGEDCWCAIAVTTDEQWMALCKAIGQPEWARGPKFASLEERKANEDELDGLIREWTKQQDPRHLEELLQSAGVPASCVETAEDLLKDPQLEHHGYFHLLKHKEIGVHVHEVSPFKFSTIPTRMFAAPCIGEHNEYVYHDILGLSHDEISDLMAEGVITTEANLPPGLVQKKD
ncbi:CaiB/BaiF CoA transferase family protein [Chloroflexota bacterium]